jgi:hypothetical protein
MTGISGCDGPGPGTSGPGEGGVAGLEGGSPGNSGPGPGCGDGRSGSAGGGAGAGTSGVGSDAFMRGERIRGRSG